MEGHSRRAAPNPPKKIPWKGNLQARAGPKVTGHLGHQGGEGDTLKAGMYPNKGLYLLPHKECPSSSPHPHFTLLVSSSPESPLWPKENLDPVVVQEGAPLTLQCNPPPGLPSPVIFWMSSCKSREPHVLLRVWSWGVRGMC